MKYKLTVLGKIALTCFIVLLIIMSSVLLTYSYCKKSYQQEFNNRIKKIMYQKELNNINNKAKAKNVSGEVIKNDEIKMQLYFAPDSVLLDKKYYASLNQIIGNIRNINNIGVCLVGSCATMHDSLSSSEIKYNYDIGLKRANSVANFLESKGICKNNISIKSTGSSKPIRDNGLEEGRKYNRTCEMTIFYIN